jgi:hypothetical protein
VGSSAEAEVATAGAGAVAAVVESPSPAPVTIHVTDEERIDMDELRRPDPILWSDIVTLFEDELGDNGTSLLTVKVVRSHCT